MGAYIDGVRHQKSVNGNSTVHLWDGANIAAEADASGAVLTSYVRGIGLLSGENLQDNTSQSYLFNAHGDVVQLAGDTGEILWEYDYDAFGNEKEVEGQDKSLDNNPFRYCGEYFDKETGDIYLRARYYNPRLGRFGAEDPIRDGLNWYTYCENNPIFFIDPNGKDAISITQSRAVSGAGHTSTLVQDKNNNWWFFYFGETIKFRMIDDKSALDSLEAMNIYLVSEGLLGKDDVPYDMSTYIIGDFTLSYEFYTAMSGLGTPDKQEFKSIFSPTGDVYNQYYNLLLSNCSQVSIMGLMFGELNNGTHVFEHYSEYMEYYGGSSNLLETPVPVINQLNMSFMFYNSSFTCEDALSNIELKQWFYSRLSSQSAQDHLKRINLLLPG